MTRGPETASRRLQFSQLLLKAVDTDSLDQHPPLSRHLILGELVREIGIAIVQWMPSSPIVNEVFASSW